MGISLSAGALKVLGERYLRKGPDGRVSETPEEMFRRVASNIAGAEKNRKDRDRYAEEFFRVMSKLEFLPNSPALMNAGTRLQQLAACFVLPVDDSLDSIFEAVKETALIHQSGGGTGFSFSRLRPSNDMVGSTGGVASGPVSFMRVFNAATEAIKQGGTRRGANMGVLSIDHPDIISFIIAKENPREFTNFNLSVAVTDEFMNAVEKNEGYRLVNPRTGKAAGEKKSAEVFDLIALSAWRNGEPGIIFIDAMNRANPTPDIGAFEATNPCGEQPLLSHEPCILGSVNLSKMLKKEGKGRWLDYKKLEDTVRLGVRFLDNAVDMGRYPVPEIERMAKGNRKIGLGVMGFADMLAKMRIPYASDEGFKTGEEVMRFIRD
ncbi:MAG: adenosylcobalamin-dependent ribonucleoside-diphosphate reductase, partial [Deltaproteobacteria bacterium]